MDSNGLLLAVADTQDRDGAFRAPGCAGRSLLDDHSGGGCRGLIEASKNALSLAVQTFKRVDGIKGFPVLPRRWVVERAFAWICKHRRCVCDYETRPDLHEAMVYIAMVATVSPGARPGVVACTRVFRCTLRQRRTPHKLGSVHPRLCFAADVWRGCSGCVPRR
ncbi:transposase [Rhodococcus sp. NPDC019627]|uniref:transposase n=1 Tax=unclassified Rhodococcus (in: high G+C Gram-positive bacteria) TaxID=192944 RepID=UPI003407E66F